jgi:hypothetical protein
MTTYLPFVFNISLTSTARSHIRINKRGAIVRVVKGGNIFEFQIWG